MGLEGRVMTFNGLLNPTFSIQDKLIQNYQVYDFGASSIAGTNGKLLLACTGYYIMRRDGDTILGGGGYGLNYPKIRLDDQGWSSWTQNSIILPNGSDEYYVFTTTMSDSAWTDWDNGFNFRFDMLTYHLVDMKENNGLGKVIKRNQILMQDARLSHNRMTAVKHANGRDWWLVKPHQNKHLFYLFLVTPNGIQGPFERSVNLPDMEGISGLYGQSTFNRTGDMYAYCAAETDGVFVLNFDRCTGDFSPYHFFSIPTRNPNLPYDFSTGCSFSPDGKLLYANTASNVYQLELGDTTANSVQFIHGPDISSDSLNYFQEYLSLNLGPDDRLYVGNFSGTRNTLSYIDNPNVRGQSCNFCAACLAVGNGNAKGLPNMPYYHLGKKVGSVCDTIGKLQYQEIKLYPNPVNSELKVYLPLEYNSEVKTELYSISGQRLLSLKNLLNYRQEYSIDMSGLAQGLYFFRIASEGRVWKEKVVKE